VQAGLSPKLAKEVQELKAQVHKQAKAEAGSC
jgi:hypothetical protein